MSIQKLLLSATLAAALLPAAHAQQGVNIATGGVLTDYTTWHLFGSATALNQTPGNGYTYSDLILTSVGTGGQAGAGFAPTALSIDFNQAFHFDFNFFLPVNAGGIRGDGLTFTLANTPGLGSAGSGLGYENLDSHSVAFAIDTFHFPGEPVSPSIQILQAGSVTPVAATETGLGDAIRDPDYQWFATVDYNPSGNNDQTGLLTGTIYHLNLGTYTVSASVDFAALGMDGAQVYYGFTASNGLADDGHIITSAIPMAVPEPDEWMLLVAGLAVVAWTARRRAG